MVRRNAGLLQATPFRRLSTRVIDLDRAGENVFETVGARIQPGTENHQCCVGMFAGKGDQCGIDRRGTELKMPHAPAVERVLNGAKAA